MPGACLRGRSRRLPSLLLPGRRSSPFSAGWKAPGRRRLPGIPGGSAGSPKERGASTTRRRGSTSGRVAARRATSGSAPSSKRPASENEDLNPAPAASCTLQEKDIRILQVVDNQVEKACGLRSIYELVVISQR